MLCIHYHIPTFHRRITEKLWKWRGFFSQYNISKNQHVQVNCSQKQIGEGGNSEPSTDMDQVVSAALCPTRQSPG